MSSISIIPSFSTSAKVLLAAGFLSYAVNWGDRTFLDANQEQRAALIRVGDATDTPLKEAPSWYQCFFEERGLSDRAICFLGHHPEDVHQQISDHYKLAKVFGCLAAIYWLTKSDEKPSDLDLMLVKY